jgi:hypothetical protein
VTDPTCFCGHRLSDHDADIEWICKRWREGSEEWCYCTHFLPQPVNQTGTAAITLTVEVAL